MIQRGTDKMSNADQYAVMQQRPVVSGLARSVFADADKSQISGVNPVRLNEIQCGHIVIRGLENVIKDVVQSQLELALPTEPLSCHQNEAACIRWISPDEWLVTVAEDETHSIEVKLRHALEGHAAIVNVSGGQTLLQLAGQHAEEVLMKSTSYDVHESNLQVGKVVTTTFAHTQVVLRRLDANSFELVVRRSFADYVFAWIRDAATEFGINAH